MPPGFRIPAAAGWASRMAEPPSHMDGFGQDFLTCDVSFGNFSRLSIRAAEDRVAPSIHLELSDFSKQLTVAVAKVSSVLAVSVEYIYIYIMCIYVSRFYTDS